MCSRVEHIYEQKTAQEGGFIFMSFLEEWPFNMDGRLTRSTAISSVLIILACLARIMAGGDRAEGLSPLPALNWVAAVLAVLAVALYLTGVVYRSRQKN